MKHYFGSTLVIGILLSTQISHASEVECSNDVNLASVTSLKIELKSTIKDFGVAGADRKTREVAFYDGKYYGKPLTAVYPYAKLKTVFKLSSGAGNIDPFQCEVGAENFKKHFRGTGLGLNRNEYVISFGADCPLQSMDVYAGGGSTPTIITQDGYNPSPNGSGTILSTHFAPVSLQWIVNRLGTRFSVTATCKL